MTYVTKKTMNKTNENKYTKINAPIVEALKNAYENPSYQFHIPPHCFSGWVQYDRSLAKRM